MRTQYFTAATLDGFIATDDHSLDWLFPLADLEKTSYPAFFAEVGALAMGASTYEWLLQHVVRLGSGTQGAWPYQVPAWVFTHRAFPSPAGSDVRFVQGDVRPVHAAMRAAAGDRNLWIVGGGELVGQFHDAGLLDQLIIQLGSVTLGSGKPLLPRRILSPELRLTEVSPMSEGNLSLNLSLNLSPTASHPAPPAFSAVTTSRAPIDAVPRCSSSQRSQRSPDRRASQRAARVDAVSSPRAASPQSRTPRLNTPDSTPPPRETPRAR